MKYTKIRLDFKYAEKGRFYRVVLVKGNPTLDILGEMFVNALGGELEQCFLYHSKDVEYIPQEWLDDWSRGEPIEIHYLSELNNTFEFDYDTGDGWDFICKKYVKPVEIDKDVPILITEGAGMGIWEDNIGSLYAYLNGDISPDFDGEDEEEGIFKPWNHDIDKYSDFDKPLDIEELNEELEFSCDFAYYDDVDFDDEQPYVNLHLKDAIINAVKEQCESLPYVKNKVKQLSLKYGKEKALEMVGGTLITIIYEMETQNHPFDEEKYKKLLNTLN